MQRPKFGRIKEMDFSSKIDVVIEHTECSKHGAGKDDPCFHVLSSSGVDLAAVCGKRAGKIYIGHVTTQSTRRNGSLSNKGKNESRYPKKENAA